MNHANDSIDRVPRIFWIDGTPVIGPSAKSICSFCGFAVLAKLAIPDRPEDEIHAGEEHLAIWSEGPLIPIDNFETQIGADAVADYLYLHSSGRTSLGDLTEIARNQSHRFLPSRSSRLRGER